MVPPGVSRGDRKGFAETQYKSLPREPTPRPVRSVDQALTPALSPVCTDRGEGGEGQLLLLDSDRFLLLRAAAGLGAIVLPEEDAAVLIHVGQNRIAC